MYRFTWAELWWAIAISVGVQIAVSLMELNAEAAVTWGLDDWRRWAVAVGISLIRPIGAALLNALRQTMQAIQPAPTGESR